MSDVDDLKTTATAAITDNINTHSRMSNQDVANTYTGDAMAAGRGLLNSRDNYNGGLSYGDRATSAAIKSRYDKQYQQSENQLKLTALKGAESDHLRNLTIATKAAGEEIALNKKKLELKWQKEQQDKKARGAIVGTTLGIIGGVVGGVVGTVGTAGVGTAAGAAGGYALGNSLGNSIGGA